MGESEFRWAVGQLVRFAHQRDGGPVHRVSYVAPDGMIELEDMVGFFGPHLFVAADEEPSHDGE